MGTPGNNLGKAIAGWFKKNSTKVLTGTAVVGTAATGYFAWKMRPYADAAIAKAEKEKGAPLTKWEKVKTAFPYCIPAVATAVTGSAAAITAEATNLKHIQNANVATNAAMSAYNMYKTASAKVYGDDAVQKIETEVLECPENWTIDDYEYGFKCNTRIGYLDTEERLFYDDYSKRFFMSSIGKVQDAMAVLNHDIQSMGDLPLSLWYEHLGIYDQFGEASRNLIDTLGWKADVIYNTMGCESGVLEIGFITPLYKRPDGTDVIRIFFKNMPQPDYTDLDYDLAKHIPEHLDEVN